MMNAITVNNEKFYTRVINDNDKIFYQIIINDNPLGFSSKEDDVENFKPALFDNEDLARSFADKSITEEFTIKEIEASSVTNNNIVLFTDTSNLTANEFVAITEAIFESSEKYKEYYEESPIFREFINLILNQKFEPNHIEVSAIVLDAIFTLTNKFDNIIFNIGATEHDSPASRVLAVSAINNINNNLANANKKLTEVNNEKSEKTSDDKIVNPDDINEPAEVVETTADAE